MISAHRQGTFKPHYFRILAIDGGGIRGIIPLCLLNGIEQQLKARTHDANACLADFFDLIVGTSTGSIIGGGLLAPADNSSRPKYDPAELIELYCNYSREIFGASFWQSIKSIGGLAESKFSDDGIRQVMHQFFGDLELKDLLKPCLFPAYDIKRQQNFYFRQHRACLYPHENFMARDIIRACTAAPIVFPVARVRSQANRSYHFIDGGLFAYNPAACAYIEVRKLFPESRANNMVMLSLSGGTYNDVELPDENKYNWGAWEWMRTIHYIASSSQIHVVASQMEEMFLTCANRNQYLRIHPGHKTDHVRLDDTSPGTIDTLRQVGKQTLEQYQHNIEMFIDLLLKEAAEDSQAWRVI